MAGGSQDLLQPNNLALSWCKYTSMIPSLKRALFIENLLQTYTPPPEGAALAPLPLPLTPFPPFLFQCDDIYTYDAHPRSHTGARRVLGDVWTARISLRRASVQKICVEHLNNPFRKFHTRFIIYERASERCMIICPVPVYIPDNCKVCFSEIKCKSKLARTARARARLPTVNFSAHVFVILLHFPEPMF